VNAPMISNEHLVLGHRGFQWFVTLSTGGAAVYWLAIDSLRLRKAMQDDRARPTVKDRIFGSIVGLVIAGIGILGAYLGHP
jgi:hypothetical protein